MLFGAALAIGTAFTVLSMEALAAGTCQWGGTFKGKVINFSTITGGTFEQGIDNRGGKVPEPSSTPAASESAETSSPVHEHSYAWVTVQEANAGQDGIEEYRCSCGDVQERCVIPASETAVKGLPADEDYFYGYFFFVNAVGATIEAI